MNTIKLAGSMIFSVLIFSLPLYGQADLEYSWDSVKIGGGYISGMKGETIYLVYNADSKTNTVTFTDGAKFNVPPVCIGSLTTDSQREPNVTLVLGFRSFDGKRFKSFRHFVSLANVKKPAIFDSKLPND